MVYNSWITMQANGETDADTCAYNDLALIKLDPADAANVDPSVPGFGGPPGSRRCPPQRDRPSTRTATPSCVAACRSSARSRAPSCSSRSGWSTDVYTVTPGIPGDSGSGFMTATGQAAGILSTVQIAPLAGSNGVGDLPRELNYMHAHGGPNATVVNGTKPFNPRSPERHPRGLELR